MGFPSDEQLLRSLLEVAVRSDSFPWLPTPKARVVIAVAPDERRFREWIGPAAPEWGAAIAIPEQRTVIMQGRRAGSGAGDPRVVLRHELAHLALDEALGDLPPRWFHEGYASVAAGEWGRQEVLATSVALLLRGMPSLDSLDRSFEGTAPRADAAYALAHRAVTELASLDPERGLSLFFTYWRDTRSLEVAIRRAFGVTQAQFEERWRSRTRRQYGALAIAADLSLAAAILMTIVVPLYMARRRRDRRRLEAMRAADAGAERAARESALAALLGDQGAQDADPDERSPS
ncbi:MAG: peptidase MA family metallohydrolase [Gemmatimonadaceae bacterium]